MGGGRRLDRERYWRGVIREQRASGLSVSAFCRERGVASCSFYSWRRRIEKPQRENGSDGPHQSGGDGSSDSNIAAKFVPVEMHASRVVTRAGCEVVLPNGCRVVVPAQCDVRWLCEVLGALQQERAC